MKKGIILFAILAVACYGFAQQTLIYDSFEEYTVGNPISAEANAAGHTWWTTWLGIYGTPVSSEDGLVSADYASDGSQSAFISGSNDNVLLLGDLTEGVYDLSFDVYTESGQMAYINLGFPGSEASNWSYGLSFYINMEVDNSGYSWYSPGHGAVVGGSFETGHASIVADLPCVEDEWMHFCIHYYRDINRLELYFNNVLITSKYVDFNAVDFYGMGNSGFYLDNVSLVRLGVFPVAEFTITPESIEETMGVNKEKTVEITLSNNGEAEGHWSAYLEFEEGEPNSWAAIDKIDGFVPVGGTDHFNLTLNTTGLANTNYEARLNIMTSSRDRTIVEIPIVLHVGGNAVSESSETWVNVYPNPAHSEITLEGDNLSSVSIYNIVGQLVRVEALNGNSNTLSLDLEQGVYFFRVDDRMGNHSVQKVVVR